MASGEVARRTPWQSVQRCAATAVLELLRLAATIGGTALRRRHIRMLAGLGAAGRPRSAGSGGQSFAQRQPLAADPGPYAADHCNDRNEQKAQKHRVFDQRGAILVFAQAADESQGV